MTSRMGSYDIFLNTNDSYLKHDSLDIMEGTTWHFDDDKFLESIRYGDKLLEDDENDLSNKEQEPDSSEMIEFESSELIAYAVGEEIMSADSASSAESCTSETMDEQNNDFSVVELVGILPSGLKTYQIVQQDELEHDTDEKINVPKDIKIVNVQTIKKISVTTQHALTTFQELKLSDEEKRLLLKEGITMPSHYPLTKSEERELKRIRRKIRNKISAQDSRKRKKEFLDTLQQKMQEVEEEKSVLNKKVRTLELVNARLSAQVRKLQTALAHIAKSSTTNTPGNTGATNGHNPNVVPAATTLLVLILSLALVVLPTVQKASKANSSNNIDNALIGSLDDSNPNTSISGRSRTMMSISRKDGMPPRYEVEDWEDFTLKGEPMAKLPRFSFHREARRNEAHHHRQRLAARLENTKRRNGAQFGFGVGGKKNLFQLNHIMNELD